MLALVLWLSLASYDPVQMFIYRLSGCKTDCAAETQRFVDSRAIYLAVEGRHLLLKPNGAIEVLSPTPTVALRYVVATLPRRETETIMKVADQLRDTLETPHRQWLDQPASLDAGEVTLAFALKGKLHFVQKSAIYLSHDYYTLLVTLLPYLDGDALAARAKHVRVEKVPEKFQMYSHIEYREERWHAQELQERVVTTLETIDRTKTNLRGYRIVHDAPDHVTVQMDIEYDGSHGDSVLTCASTFDNARDSHDTGCRPNSVRKGRSTVCAMIVATKESPATFETTTLEIPLYERGSGQVFYTVRLPLWKAWKRAAGNVECAQCNGKCGM
jgi:hypothetical protein